jgi:hypothetical protein
MKKAFVTLIILVVLILIMSLSAWTDYAVGLNFFTNSHNSRTSVNVNRKDRANIGPNVGLPGWTIIGADSIDAGGTRLYSTPCSEFEMVKKVLEPNTMLLLGGCLLGFSFFAMKYRR